MNLDRLRPLGGVPRPPGPGQTAPQSPLYAGAREGGGWVEPNVRRVVLAKVNTAGTTRTSASVAARLDNPSARLVCSFSITFEPTTPQNFTNYNSAEWTARIVRPNSQDGREALLHELFGNEALPQGYEMTSSMRGVLITATLTIPLDGGGSAIEGNWVCEAQWEPAIPMCPEEAAAMYSRTALKLALAAAGPLAP